MNSAMALPASREKTKQGGWSVFPDYLLSLIDELLPDIGSAEPDLQRRSRLLVAISIAFCLISLFFGVVMTLLGSYPVSSLAVMYGCALVALSNIVLIRVSGSTALAGLALCTEVLIAISYQSFVDSGLDDPTLLWLLAIPWLAAILVRPSFGFVFAGLTGVVIGVFYFLEVTGYPFPDFSTSDQTSLFYLLNGTTVAFFFGFLGWLYEGQTLRNLRQVNYELSKAHQALQASNRRVEGILASINDAFFALDSEGAVTYLNRKAAQLFGVPSDRLLGAKVMQHVAARVSPRMVRRFYLAARNGSPEPVELYYPPTRHWLEVRIYRFPQGFSVYIHDVSERKDYERQLIEAKERAEELARMQDAFVANMSHELRTPLTGIIGYASLLAQETTDTHKEFAQIIKEHGNRLQRTLGSVMEWAMFQSDSARAKPENLNVEEIARDVVAFLSPRARERGLFLRFNTTLENPSLHADRSFLFRVLSNLVDNAIKFTDQGGVAVRVGGDRRHVYIHVQDTGIGIAPDFLPRLFDPFQQESTGLARTHEGSGLGLPITRRMVEAMNGTIDVKSSPAGSTFIVRFPRTFEPAHS